MTGRRFPGDAETRRLRLRRPWLRDAPALLAILGDKQAMRLTHSIDGLKECRRYLAGHACQAGKTGYGPWTVIEKASGRIVGFGGLYDDPFDRGWGPEVSYRFAPAVWGLGYASELAAFALAFGHGRLGLGLIKAFAHPDNAASRRVLAKAGFREERFVEAMNRVLYAHRG
jgi:RimJ/RimL family protein N-acetyltransferase